MNPEKNEKKIKPCTIRTKFNALRVPNKEEKKEKKKKPF